MDEVPAGVEGDEEEGFGGVRGRYIGKQRIQRARSNVGFDVLECAGEGSPRFAGCEFRKVRVHGKGAGDVDGAGLEPDEVVAVFYGEGAAEVGLPGAVVDNVGEGGGGGGVD